MSLNPKYLEVNFYTILLGISLITISIGNLSRICNRKLNCDDCIRIPNCAWCAQENDSVELRCFEIGKDLCPESFTINPRSESKILKTDELSRIKLKNKELRENKNKNLKVIQIKPQRVSLKLRPNEVYNLNFKFLQADDYPLDLYYLMDLSYSMIQHKDKLSNLGNKLASQMKNITKNFKLGFGSFIDKVVMPFTETTPEALKNPCRSVNKTCAPPYSYKNHMSLSTNTSQFAHKVKEAEVSANDDIPEGGFDAIMQSIVCHEQIGWREGARRLIVFSTDASFHYAGDGKLAGIILPNDGQCHMENNQYTHAEILDYPSVYHLNKILNTNAVNMIFAVTKDVEKIYKNLSDVIESASIGIIDNDSSNILELIKTQYNKITSNIEIKDDAMRPVNIKYFTTCLNKNDNEIESNKCDKLKDDSLIEFRAQISFTNCPTQKKYRKQTFYIYPVGIDERITVDLEMICDCDCKNSNHLYEKDSKKCNEHGTYECGLCKCNEGYSGKQCECPRVYNDLKGSLKGCRHDDSTCSGFGNCICGKCECNKRQNSNEIYYGKYCECDNFSCPRSNNLICSGHGICDCGQCVCNIGWDGSACECSTSTKNCFQSPDQEICSGHGICPCGNCQCKIPYHGEFCENCPTCEKRCEEFRNCIECQVYKNETLDINNECINNCTLFNATIVDKIEERKDNDTEKWELCKLIDKNKCEFVFEYTVNNKLKVRAEKDKKCPRQDSVVKTASTIILPFLAFGLFGLVSWKVTTTIHDRREYLKFERQQLLAKWGSSDNPLYKVAQSSYQNPAFTKDQ